MATKQGTTDTGAADQEAHWLWQHEPQWFVHSEPAAVGSTSGQSLEPSPNEAEAAFEKGVQLFCDNSIAASIPYFRRALSIVKRSQYFIALGSACLVENDLDLGAQLLTEGLALAAKAEQEQDQAVLADLLGQILLKKGDLDGALGHMMQALEIKSRLFGPHHSSIAVVASNIGRVFQDLGNLEKAFQYTWLAKEIDIATYGSAHPSVAVRCNNLGQILFEQGDLDRALEYTERALRIDEANYGSDHPSVAIDVNNVCQIFHAQGDLDQALSYAERALRIDEKYFAPGHPNLAFRHQVLTEIIEDRGGPQG